MTQIDVTKPLELSDGTWAEFTDVATGLWIEVKIAGEETCFFYSDGSPHDSWRKEAAGRTLRNRQEPQSTDPKLVEEALALVRWIATVSPKQALYRNEAAADWEEKAKEIYALLHPKPKTDEEWAREAVCRSHHDKHPESPWHQEQAKIVRSGANDRMLDVMAAREGIRIGRELERENPS